MHSTRSGAEDAKLINRSGGLWILHAWQIAAFLLGCAYLALGNKLWEPWWPRVTWIITGTEIDPANGRPIVRLVEQLGGQIYSCIYQARVRDRFGDTGLRCKGGS